MRNPVIASIEANQYRTDIPHFTPGDTIRVHSRITEGEKERVQVFEGVVLKKRNAGLRSSFTVRKVSYGVGVERIFPIHSPRIEKIEVVTGGAVRRAKIYFLRELHGRKARLKEEAVRTAENKPIQE